MGGLSRKRVDVAVSRFARLGARNVNSGWHVTPPGAPAGAETPHSLDDTPLLLERSFRDKSAAPAPASGVLAGREIACVIAEVAQAFLLMQRHRIVDFAADAARP